MSRRSAIALLILALLVGAGRWVRHALLLGPEGRWREPGLWADHIPPAVSLSVDPPRRVLTAPLNINSCSEDSLTLLPGIGPVLAQRIAAARRAGCRFASIADLRQIKGIGTATSRRLEPHLNFTLPDSIRRDMTNQQ